MSGQPILELTDVRKQFVVGGRVLKAVEGVDLIVYKGETFGLVGESGCGKSTLGRMIKGIYAVSSGRITFEGADISRLKGEAKRGFARKMQIVFQDPYSSLNPRMTVGEIISEGLEIHKLGTAEVRAQKARQIMDLVGLNPEYENRFPHEFSGGQRQRIAIARALVVDPDMVICDEPISALDVSIQGQIVNLLKDLQRRLGLTYLFVAHDLSMVKYISDRVGVMYLGRLVELAPKAELFGNPLHPYTRALLSSIPIPDPERERKRVENIPKGELPSPFADIRGCPFQTRCPQVSDACTRISAELTDMGNGHGVNCVLHGTPAG